MNDIDKNKQTVRSTDIAIIGMAGRFPEADTLDTFWDNLTLGKESIRPFPKERIRELEEALGTTPDWNYVRAGYLQQVTYFEPEIFGLSKEESKYMDPQHRLLIELVEESILDAGYNPVKLADQYVGVFVAGNRHNYPERVFSYSPMSYLGSIPSAGMGRVAYLYNFHGPAFTLDTACSSSLVALHYACQSLRLGECDLAIAGGAEIILLPGDADEIELAVLSKKQQVRAFDQNASGTVPGEGGAIVLLKPLGKAIEDGDHIHGVIKGNGINSDGGWSNGLTAPSQRGQTEVILRALKQADIDPGSINYIETHGTGTPLGDPLEIAGLQGALGQFDLPYQSIPIGSVKPNIGHLNAAAGIAGVMKALMTLKHGQIPPSINFTEPNQMIDFTETSVYVNDRLSEMEGENPRRVAVTSLGLTGTNCHIILEEAPEFEQDRREDWQQLIALSARTGKSLIEMGKAIRDFLREKTEIHLTDVAYTLNTGRRDFSNKLFLIAANTRELLEKLTEWCIEPQIYHCTPEKLASIFIFPDLNQFNLDWARELYAREANYQRLVDLARKKVREWGNLPVAKEDYFSYTYAFAELLQLYGLKPRAVLGFGVGDHLADLVMGRISLDKALDCLQKYAGQTEVLQNKLEGLITKILQAGIDYFILLAHADSLVETFSTVLQGSIGEMIGFGGRDVTFYQGLIQLIEAGLEVSWEAIYSEIPHRRLSLPGYVFDRQCYFAKPDRQILDGEVEESHSKPTIQLGDRQTVRKALSRELAELYVGEELQPTASILDMGFDSIDVLQFVGRIRREYDCEIPMQLFFEDVSFAEIVEELTERIVEQNQSHHQPKNLIPKVKEQDYYPVAPAQSRLLILHQLDPTSTNYNISGVIQIDGDLDVDQCQKSLQKLVQRHEALRTYFTDLGEEPVQVIEPEVEFELDQFDVAPGQIEEKIDSYIRPFDLGIAPLFRVGLLKLTEKSQLLIFDMHHLISDGTSLTILINEFVSYYLGQPLPPLQIQYKDYAVWKREELQSERMMKQKEYWRNRLAGDLPQLKMPLDFSRPPIRTFDGQTLGVTLDAGVAQKLKDLARRHNCTLNILLLALYGLLLHNYSGAEDVVVGSIVAGRNHGDLAHVIGMFVNFLPIRLQIKADETFGTYLSQAREDILADYNHQDYPFEKMVEQLKIQSSRNRNPLFDTMLILHNESNPYQQQRIANLEVSGYQRERKSATLDFKLDIFPVGNELNCVWEYNTNLFTSDTIERLGDHFQKLIKMVVKEPEKCLNDYLLLDDTEKSEIKARLEKSVGKREISMTGTNNVATLPIAITATFTAEPMGDYLRWWCQKMGHPVDIRFASYNQVFQELLNDDSLISQNTGANLLLIRFEDWIRNDQASDEILCEKLERNYTELVQILRDKKKDVPYFVAHFPISTHLGLSETVLTYLKALNIRWKQAVDRIEDMYLVDLRELAQLYQISQIFDEQKDQAGHLPFSDEYFGAMGTIFARQICIWKKQHFKVIALDCDNTLWQGVCGEDGSLGVQVTEPYRQLQEFMIEKYEQGMLLVLCTKNNESDLWEVFDKNPQMRLKREHIANWRINWEPKSSNIRVLAKELNLGLDSFIFIDDNPLECTEVMTNCPQVLTFNLPKKPDLIPGYLKHIWAFDRFKVTAEDKKRTQMYIAERKRQEMQKEGMDLSQFLKNLELKMTMGQMRPEELARTAQLTQRTNQFNMSTIRRTEEEVLKILENPGMDCWTIRIQDRFGDYGIVGVLVIVEKDQTLQIDTFLLSCRVLGRQVEDAILIGLKRECQQRGIGQLEATFVPTAKNQPFREFIGRMGWVLVEEGENVEHYQIPLENIPEESDYVECLFHPDGGEIEEFLKNRDNNSGNNRENAPLNQLLGRVMEEKFEAGQVQRGIAVEDTVKLNQTNQIKNPNQEVAVRAEQSMTTGMDEEDQLTGKNNWHVLIVNEEELLHRSQLLPLEYHTGEKLLTLRAEFEENEALVRADYEPPRNKIEERLAQIYEEVLGVKQVGAKDHFFHLGGHSLKATSLISRLYRDLQVQISLREVFQYPTVEELAAWIHGVEKNQYIGISPVSKRDFYPVSSAQKRLYFLHQLESAHTSYNIPGAILIEGMIDPNRLEMALHQLIQRHESLRTSFEMVDGEPVQIIHKQVTFAMEFFEVDHQDQMDEKVTELIRPFDLAQAPLFRAGLISNQNQHLLLFDMHHIVSDGRSVRVLIQEFIQLFLELPLPALPIQYKDYAVWQEKLLTSGEMDRQERYWCELYKEEIPLLNLPTDFPRPAELSYRGDKVRVHLSPSLTTGLNQLAKEEGATLFMVLLASYYTLLYKYTGQEDLVVGTPVAGRSQAELENIVGMFVNTLPLRARPQGQKSFLDFLLEVKALALASYQHQNYQFEMLVEKLDVQRDLSRNPLFDTMFVLQNTGMAGSEEVQEITGLTFKPYEFSAEIAQFDLTLRAIERRDEIVFDLEYSIDLFKESTICRLTKHLLSLQEQIITDPTQVIRDLEMITPEEKREILETFNNTQYDYSIERSAIELFSEQAGQIPNQEAIIYGHQAMTYRELNERANRLAHTLIQRGVQPNQVVGIMLERSFEMMIGIFAIQKAGGAYLPISPTYPAERIEFMLQDSSAQLLLIKEEPSEELDFAGEVLDISTEDVYSIQTDQPPIRHGMDDLAYVIYTSGSTGKPKGVLIEHAAILNRLLWMKRQYPIGEGDTLLQKTPFTFDVSLIELFYWSLTGARLVPLESGAEKSPQSIIETIEEQQVTMIHFVPSMLRIFLEYIENEPENYKRLASLKRVVASGEALHRNQVQKFNELLYSVNGTTLLNLYGPTEAAVEVSYFECSPEPALDIVPIGKPIDNVQLYIINQDQQLQPVGVYGELCIAGRCLSRGYQNRPKLTREKFIENPFREGERIYRTGDLVRWLEDGNIEFVGRMDHQVKIRGYRIELGEIENLLLREDPIKEVVVVDRKDTEGIAYLCAYVISEDHTEENEKGIVERLRRGLARRLPKYMIPQYFVFLDEIPLSVNGKVDRKQLPDPTLTLYRNQYRFPVTLMEERLGKIWEELLGVEKIGLDDDFFQLGGHSLKANQLTARISQEFEVMIPLKEVFKHSTLQTMADFIDAAEREQFYAITRVDDRKSYPVSPAQRRLLLRYQINQNDTSYNMPNVFEIDGTIDEERLASIFEELIRRHEPLRTSFEFRGGRLGQRIHENVDFAVERINTSEAELHQVIQQFIRPFDLKQPPLLRVGIIGVSEKQFLIFDVHHVIADGISISILMEEFCQLYMDRDLPELKIQYRDYVLWLQEELESEKIQNQKSYWLEKLSDAPVLLLPTDKTRPDWLGGSGGSYLFNVERELTASLKEYLLEQECTLFMGLLATYTILLSKYSGQSDLVVGTPVSGRPHADLERLMGMFVSTLALRNRPLAELSFGEFLLEIKTNTLQAFENQDYPFEEIIDQLSIKRDMSRNPIFDVMFALQNNEMAEISFGDLVFKPYRFSGVEAKFDLILNAVEYQQEIEMNLMYRKELYFAESIEQMAKNLMQIIRAVVNDPDCRIGDIEITSGVQELEQAPVDEIDFDF